MIVAARRLQRPEKIYDFFFDLPSIHAIVLFSTSSTVVLTLGVSAAICRVYSSLSRPAAPLGNQFFELDCLEALGVDFERPIKTGHRIVVSLKTIQRAAF